VCDTNSDPKHILQSKTFWTNLLAPIFLYITMKWGIQLSADAETVIIFVIMSITNIILRLFTTQPATLLPPPPPPPAPSIPAPNAG
jgi:hypothetical protein